MPTPAPETGKSSVSSNGSPEQRMLLKQSSSVGFLCRSLPQYVQKPPIEAVVFGWGVNEDGQLVCIPTPFNAAAHNLQPVLLADYLAV